MIKLFNIFFRIGMFTLGGGYAMVPVIETEIVEKINEVDKKTSTDY